MGKLIILRGPSASGKSSVADQLKQCARSNIVDNDHNFYRVNLLDKVDLAIRPNLAQDMMINDTLIALNQDCDVILHSIFATAKSMRNFPRLFAAHPRDNFIFTLLASYDETVRRHAARKKSAEFGSENLEEWYSPHTATSYKFEEMIPEDSSLADTVARIIAVTGIPTA